MQDVFVRTPYNYDADQASLDSGLRCEDVSRTQQHFQEECDINTIVRRFGLDGDLPEGVRRPMYGDFTGIGDFRDAIEAVRRAEDSFMAMPAAVRSRFENDPGAFVDFCNDPANKDEWKKLGLVDPDPVAPAPMRVEVVNPAPAPDPAPAGK